MELYIDTSVNPEIKLILKNGADIIAQESFAAKYQQAEKLLVAIDELLSKSKVGLDSLTKIFVTEKGDSFSALRIGVITANSLAYALGIPINDKTQGSFGVVQPVYDREPNITIPSSPQK